MWRGGSGSGSGGGGGEEEISLDDVLSSLTSLISSSSSSTSSSNIHQLQPCLDDFVPQKRRITDLAEDGLVKSAEIDSSCAISSNEASYTQQKRLRAESVQPEKKDDSATQTSDYPFVDGISVLSTANNGIRTYKRLLVLEVSLIEPETQSGQPSKLMRLFDEISEEELYASLSELWISTPVQPGDYVNVIGAFCHIFNNSTRSYEIAAETKKGNMCVVDNSENAVVLHPDWLLAGTSLSTSLSCLRRAVLSELLNVIYCFILPFQIRN